LDRLDVGQNSFYGSRTRIAPVPQIEDETRIADNIASKTGRSCVALAKEFFYLSQQMHHRSF